MFGELLASARAADVPTDLSVAAPLVRTPRADARNASSQPSPPVTTVKTLSGQTAQLPVSLQHGL